MHTNVHAYSYPDMSHQQRMLMCHTNCQSLSGTLGFNGAKYLISLETILTYLSDNLGSQKHVLWSAGCNNLWK